MEIRNHSFGYKYWDNPQRRYDQVETFGILLTLAFFVPLPAPVDALLFLLFGWASWGVSGSPLILRDWRLATESSADLRFGLFPLRETDRFERSSVACVAGSRTADGGRLRERVCLAGEPILIARTGEASRFFAGETDLLFGEVTDLTARGVDWLAVWAVFNGLLEAFVRLIVDVFSRLVVLEVVFSNGRRPVGEVVGREFWAAVISDFFEGALLGCW